MGFPLPFVSVDDDHDGIDDNLELALAERFAPFIFMSKDESNLPVNVGWFLNRANLAYYERNHGTDTDSVIGAVVGVIAGVSLGPLGMAIGGAVGGAIGGWIGKDGNLMETPPPLQDGSPGGELLGTVANLIGPGAGWTHPASWPADSDGNAHVGTHCCQDPPPGPISTTSADPEEWVDPAANDDPFFHEIPIDGTYRTWCLPDIAEADHQGSLSPGDWVTYVHVYPRTGGGIAIQYWHLFAFNGEGLGGFGHHGGDWDACIHVLLDPELEPEWLICSRHQDDSPGDWFRWTGSRPNESPVTAAVRVANAPDDPPGTEATHPLIVIDGGGHAAFMGPDDASSFHWPVTAGDTKGWRDHPTDPGHGFVWPTFPGGVVTQSPDCALKLKGDVVVPPLVNLGEYLPDRDHQAAGRFIEAGATDAILPPPTDKPPADGWAPNTFVTYSGRWGTPSDSTGIPPRCPPWQGRLKAETHIAETNTSLAQGTYAAWYNDGANVTAERIQPRPAWLDASAVSAAIEVDTSAAQLAGHAGFTDSAQAVLTPTAAQGSVAAKFGAARSIYQVDDGAWQVATGPIPFAQGTEVFYLGIDALNNRGPQLSIGRHVEAPTVTLTPALAPGDMSTPPPTQTVQVSVGLVDSLTASDALTHGHLLGDLTYGGQLMTSPSAGRGAGRTPARPVTAGGLGRLGVVHSTFETFSWSFIPAATLTWVSSTTEMTEGRTGPALVHTAYWTWYPMGGVIDILGFPDPPTVTFAWSTFSSHSVFPWAVSLKLSNLGQLAQELVDHGGDPTAQAAYAATFGLDPAATEALLGAAAQFTAARAQVATAPVDVGTHGGVTHPGPGPARPTG